MTPMTDIVIKQMNHEEIPYLNSFKSEFSVYGYLDLQVANNKVAYKIIKDGQRMKAYEEQEINPVDYIDSKHRAVYFAFVDGKLAGQVILKENWNQYGFIEDIRVKAEFKGLGVGKRLMNQAKVWATDKNLGGLTLETQNNNIDACLFYDKSGFFIGGFDNCFYKQFEDVQDEVVLYWYWLKNETN